MTEKAPDRKQQLIAAAVRLMLSYGYTATSVDQICEHAGVTKGAFFHYFASKEEICRAAMEAWAAHWEGIVLGAKFHEIEDPLERLAHQFTVMRVAYGSPDKVAGCMIGTVAQEMAVTNRTIGGDAESHLGRWVAWAKGLLDAAREKHPPVVDFDSESVAWFMCSVVQGSMLIARTRDDRDSVLPNVDHLQAYVFGLFGRPMPALEERR